MQGFGEAAPIERYDETAESAQGVPRRRRRPARRRPVRARGDRRAAGGAARRAGREVRARRRAPRPLREARRRPGLEAARAAARRARRPRWTVWLGDPGRHGAPRREAAAPRFQRLKLKLGGRDGLDVERVRAVRGVTDLPLQVDVNEYWTLDEALDAAAAPGRARRRSTVEQPLPAGDEGGAGLKAASADPDLRRRGLPHPRRRRRLRRARARDQHQAREVGRDPRGGADGARRPCARPAGDARLHDRVRPRDRGRRARRLPLRPRRPRRQPAARATTRGRASSSATASSSRPPLPASGCMKRYLILAEGHSGDPHYGKTARGVIHYGRDAGGRDPRLAAGGGDATTGFRSSATVEEALAYEPTTALVGVATAGGRFPPAWRELLRECVATGLDVENGLHEFLADDPELAALARRARRRAARPAPAAGRPQRPHRREPRARRDDRPHGRLRLCDREDDRLPRARPRGAAAAASPPSSSRPARPGSRSPAGGSPSTRWSPTSSRARPSGWSSRARERGGELLLVEGQGSLAPPGLLRRHARADARLGAARLRALPPGRAAYVDDDERFPIPPLPELVELHERMSLPARPATRRGDRAEHARPRRGRGPGARSRRPRRRRACPPTTRSGSAPAKLVDAVALLAPR